jgi:hypothetical protein
MAKKSGGWTKWWWTKVYQSANWCSKEFRAVGAFGLVFCGVFLLIGSSGFELAEAVGFGIQVKIIASISVGLLFAILNTRGIASEIFPVVVREGDDAAAERLGGTVALRPGESFVRRLWWIGWGNNSDWTDEEKWTRNAINGFAAALLLLPLLFEFRVLTNFGLSRRAMALLFVLVQLPLTFYVSRQFCVWLWPDYVKRADDAAVKRSNRNILPRG